MKNKYKFLFYYFSFIFFSIMGLYSLVVNKNKNLFIKLIFSLKFLLEVLFGLSYLYYFSFEELSILMLSLYLLWLYVFFYFSSLLYVKYYQKAKKNNTPIKIYSLILKYIQWQSSYKNDIKDLKEEIAKFKSNFKKAKSKNQEKAITKKRFKERTKLEKTMAKVRAKNLAEARADLKKLSENNKQRQKFKTVVHSIDDFVGTGEIYTFEYMGANDSYYRERNIIVNDVYQSNGYTYVDAYDVDINEDRCFRTDRIL